MLHKFFSTSSINRASLLIFTGVLLSAVATSSGWSMNKEDEDHVFREDGTYNQTMWFSNNLNGPWAEANDFYRVGKKFSETEDKKIKNFQKALRRGHAKALYALDRMVQEDSKNNEKMMHVKRVQLYSEAIKACEKIVTYYYQHTPNEYDKHDVKSYHIGLQLSHYNLATLYKEGYPTSEGTTYNFKRACDIYEQLIKRNHIYAKMDLGELLEEKLDNNVRALCLYNDLSLTANKNEEAIKLAKKAEEKFKVLVQKMKKEKHN